MRGLTAGCPDWTAVLEVEEEFRRLRDTLREFARCQHGIGVKRQLDGRMRG